MTALIDIRHVTYTYPTPGESVRPALDDISLQIEQGEYVAIVGANGSGKSTLARHLNALLIPQEGYVRVAGRNTRDPTHHPEIRRAVGMVFQRPEDQVVGTVVAHDVAFGLENLELPSGEIQSRVETTLRAVSLWEERDRPPYMLSAGQMQRLALAGILAMRPDCIVFDEATAMLDPAGRRATREMMRRLHQEGLTILTITHRMDEALEADRLVVLHQGRVVLDSTPQHLFRDPAQLHRFGLDVPPIVALAKFLAESLPGLEAGAFTVHSLVEAIEAAAPDRRSTQGYNPPQAPESAPGPNDDRRQTKPADNEPQEVVPQNFSLGSAAMQQSQDADDRPIIRTSKLGHTYMQDTPFERLALHDVDFEVRAGAACDDATGSFERLNEPSSGSRDRVGGSRNCAGGSHGLIGATGSGKSTLLQHLNGLLRPQEGRVRVLDYDLNDAAVDLRVVRRQVGLVFQRPEAQIFEQYVGDEIAYGPRLAGLEGEALRERVRWAMELVGLDFAGFKDRFTFALSGGEQRKVALASILALQPEVLLLDEPTAGLDPVSRAELLAKLHSLRRSGITLVLSSHEMEDIAALTEQVTVLSGGTVSLDGSVSAVFSNSAQLRDWGLECPVVTQVSEELRARGWPLPPGIVSADHLRAALAEAPQTLADRNQVG